jgi:hypothetical protein
MVVCLICVAPGLTQAQYEQVRNEVAPGNRLPPGMFHHVAGPGENEWCVSEVWESQEALDRFFTDRLQQALQKAGVNGQPQIFEVANTMQP